MAIEVVVSEPLAGPELLETEREYSFVLETSEAESEGFI